VEDADGGTDTDAEAAADFVGLGVFLDPFLVLTLMSASVLWCDIGGFMHVAYDRAPFVIPK
jgi:hypothetical protein